RGAPRRFPALDDQAADAEADAGADVDAARVDREGGRPSRGGKIVRQERVRGRGGARLPDPDPDARDGELAEAPRETRHCGHDAPPREAESDQAAPVPDVGEPAERNAEKRVEHGEGRPVEKPELRVGDAE